MTVFPVPVAATIRLRCRPSSRAAVSSSSTGFWKSLGSISNSRSVARIVASVRRERPPESRALRVVPGARTVRTDVHRPSTGRRSPASARPAPVDPTASCERSIRARRSARHARGSTNPRTPSRTRWRDERSTPWRAAASRSRRTKSSPSHSATPPVSLNRQRIRCAHVRRGQHAQRTAARVAVPLDLRTKLLEAAELDERAQKVDRVGAIEFASQVLEQLVALGIDDQARGMQRSARPLGRLCRSARRSP